MFHPIDIQVQISQYIIEFLFFFTQQNLPPSNFKLYFSRSAYSVYFKMLLPTLNTLQYIYDQHIMKTLVLLTLFLLTLPLIQTQLNSPDNTGGHQARPSRDSQSGPRPNQPPTWQYWPSQPSTQSPATQEPIKTDQNTQSQPKDPRGDKIDNNIPKFPNSKMPQYTNEPIPDEVVMMIIGMYSVVFLVALGVCGCCTYFCVKKNSQSNKLKRRMQELQIMFAQSQNMNVHQMNTQPNFPRTIHI